MPKITILIDDDVDDIQFLREALLDVDQDVVCHDFLSPLDAIETLAKNESLAPDFVFIDFNMPNLNGFECLLQLKAMPKMSNTRFIINSTYVDDSMKDKFLSNGAFYVFQKPYKVQSYLKILSQVLKKA